MIESWRDIPGFFNFEEVYNLAVDEAKDGETLVEVGAFLGKSAAYMAERIKQSGKNLSLAVIDMWWWESDDAKWWDMVADFNPVPWPCPELVGMRLYDAFLCATKRAGAESLIFPVRSPSVEAAKGFRDGTLPFVFIDANHHYHAIKADIAAWHYKVRRGGILAGHDYHASDWPGVTQAVDEAFGDLVEQRGTSWIVRM